MLTKRQKQVLDFIKSYRNKNKYAPSLEEIKAHLKLSSVSTAHHHVKNLQETGYLYKERNKPRALSPTNEKVAIEIPLVGTIAAGRPIEAIEIPGETITIAKDQINASGNHYALKVVGNSMINEGIYDGDIVVIKKQETADNGQTVVAIIDENEATLKKLYRERNRVRLQPANPSLFPLYRKNVEIRGVVVKIIRNLESPIERERVSDTRFKRRIDYSWDFKGEKTKSYTHGFHTYPAMFIPQVARRLLETYSRKGDTVCDIFCGSGSAIVESRLLGRNCYGIDLNPLAVFIAAVKATEINPKKLTRVYYDILAKAENIKSKSVKKPIFNNINFWFKENVITQLGKLKNAILTIRNKSIRNFFLAAFSETVRLSSNTKSSEFKLVRIPPEKLENYNPDVMGIFRKKAEHNMAKMIDFYKDVDKTAWAKIISGDSSKDVGIPEESVDCIITSPPYGDSRTTVAYGQFSRLSAQWTDIFEDPNKASSVDNNLLGGKISEDLKHNLNSDYLDDTLAKISKRDEKRAKEVLSFYKDLEKCLRQAHKILKPRKYFCLVIGNRLVKQVRIPTDYIIAELGEHIGFTCEDIFVRNIPGKRMPQKTSPTNITGELEETMTKESIVILKKTR